MKAHWVYNQLRSTIDCLIKIMLIEYQPTDLFSWLLSPLGCCFSMFDLCEKMTYECFAWKFFTHSQTSSLSVMDFSRLMINLTHLHVMSHLFFMSDPLDCIYLTWILLFNSMMCVTDGPIRQKKYVYTFQD